MHMVSTGKEALPRAMVISCLDGKHIIYASTHEAGPSCPARPDRSKGDLWAVYPGFDIYLADDKGKDRKEAARYARVRRRGDHQLRRPNKIIYTSMASGDLDLWTMKPDGSGEEADHQGRRL